MKRAITLIWLVIVSSDAEANSYRRSPTYAVVNFAEDPAQL
jgi:hypothetical protein